MPVNMISRSAVHGVLKGKTKQPIECHTQLCGVKAKSTPSMLVLLLVHLEKIVGSLVTAMACSDSWFLGTF